MKLVTVAYGEEKGRRQRPKGEGTRPGLPEPQRHLIPAGIGLPAAAEALSQSGDLDRVKITGLAPVTLISKYINTGNVQAIWWNVGNLGTLAFNTAEMYAQCKIQPTTGTSYTVDGLGKFTVGDKGVVLLGEPTIVTPENLSTFPF